MHAIVDSIYATMFFHPNQTPKFVLEAEKFFKDVASHQIYEGVCINNSKSTPGYLNSNKGAWPEWCWRTASDCSGELIAGCPGVCVCQQGQPDRRLQQQTQGGGAPDSSGPLNINLLSWGKLGGPAFVRRPEGSSVE